MEVIVSLEASWASLVVTCDLPPDLSLRWHRTLVIIDSGANSVVWLHRNNAPSETNIHPLSPPTLPLPTPWDSDSAGEICRADSCSSRKQQRASKDFRRRAPPTLAPSHKCPPA